MTPVASDTPAEPPEHHGDHDQEYQDALARRIQAILEPLGVRLGLACHVHRVSAVHVRYAAGGSGSSPSSAPLYVAPAAQFDLATLSPVPPFHIEGPWRKATPLVFSDG